MKNKICALFPACTVKDNKLFCVTDVEHIFERIDIKSGQVEYIDDPEGYNPSKWSGTDAILLHEDIVYLVEQNGEHILKYSLVSHSCQYIDVMCNDYICTNFAGITIYAGQMYMFPRYRDGVIKVNLESGTVEMKDDLCPEIEYAFNEKEPIPHTLFSCSCQVENHIWIFTERDGIAIDYDIAEEQFEKYILPESVEGCVQVEYVDGLFYFLIMEGKIYTWSPEKNIGEEICDFGKACEYPYFGIISYAGNRLWVLPLLGNDIYIIDLLAHQYTIYSNYPADFAYFAPNNWGKYFRYYSDEKYYYYAMHAGNYILIIEKKTGQEQWIKPQVPDEEKKVTFYLKNRREQFNYENIYYNIMDLIGMLKRSSKMEGQDNGCAGGFSIWNKLKHK